ncbi:TspO/MBR family protein [Paramicrobacterium agarici]|uniref:TspO/MBR family protein n=1 Tax=Paramicrobacterium agarici TaxID=630514 RepID=UPI00114EA353|nr:TspO/MBR family protein [Microbacterium agarici]TQO23650.1 TspO/MBR related protein [Microbacterium agarici]
MNRSAAHDSAHSEESRTPSGGLSDRRPRGSDRVRQIVVLVLALLAIAGAAIGSGAFGGTQIQDAAGGALDSDSTLIAPAGPAFSIWSVIYLGLLAYAVWQLFPNQAGRSVHRRVGYLIAVSMLLNAAWIGVVQLGLLGGSVAVIVALLAVLCAVFAVLQKTPRQAGSRGAAVAEAIILDGTMGLYLGWVTIATAANIAAWLSALGFTGWGVRPQVWGVIVVAVAGLIGVATALGDRGRLAPALALAWGLGWLAFGRLGGEPVSLSVGTAAVAAAVVVVVATVIVRIVAERAPERAAS